MIVQEKRELMEQEKAKIIEEEMDL